MTTEEKWAVRAVVAAVAIFLIWYLVTVAQKGLKEAKYAANLDTTAPPAITGDWDFSGGGIEIENGTTPPACTEGQLFLDTDATAGQQLMACDGGTFVIQGDGSR